MPENTAPTDQDQPEEQSDYGAWMPETSNGVDQVAAEQAEQVYLKASIPVIQDVLDWYDECVDKFKNPEVITGVNVSTPAETVKQAVLHAQQQIASYQQKKLEFSRRFSDFIATEGGETKS